MALYAIGDLHLSFSTDKPMDIFGSAWKNHIQVLETNWKARICEDDTIVLVGDHSWALKPEDAISDLTFIHNLPGPAWTGGGQWYCRSEWGRRHRCR